MSQSQPFNHSYTAPLTDAEINLILDDLDAFEIPEEVLAQREHDRVIYQSPVEVACECNQGQGMSKVRFAAVTYDLSNSGLGMIAPVATDIGTRCTLTLIGPTNNQLIVTASLKLCEPVAGRASLWGVAFDQVIDAQAFLSTRIPNRSIA